MWGGALADALLGECCSELKIFKFDAIYFCLSYSISHTFHIHLGLTGRAHRQNMAGENVLIFGGNGRIARSMTSLMLDRSWNVTSVVRNVQQNDSILRLRDNQTGKINVLNMDLRNIKSQADISEVFETVKPTCVVFAAGMALYIF